MPERRPGEKKSGAPEKKAPELSKEDAVEQLAQALLREYMHKKGAKATLAVFDEENPRTEKTIGSRAVMTSLMAMEAIQARHKQRPVPPTTFMEHLCAYRLRKRRMARGEAERDDADSSGDEGGSSAAVSQELQATRDRIAELRRQLDAAKSDRDQRIAAAREAAAAKKPKRKSGDAPDPDVEGAQEKKTKKDKKGDKAEKTDKKAKKEKKEKKAAAGAGKGAFDPLGLTASSSLATEDSLLASGRRSGSGATGPVGHAWNPMGATIPTVGLGKGGPAAADTEDAPPPKFMAGSGMELMGTRVRPIAPREDLKFTESDGKSPQRRRDSLEDSVSSYDYPSPEGGRAKYDPSAQSAGGGLKREPRRSERRVKIMADEEHE